MIGILLQTKFKTRLNPFDFNTVDELYILLQKRTRLINVKEMKSLRRKFEAHTANSTF